MAKDKSPASVGVHLAICKMGVLWYLAGGVTVRIHRVNLGNVLRTVPATWGASGSKEPPLRGFASLNLPTQS